MSKRIGKIQTCEFISATGLIPSHWTDFWGSFSSNAPFSWGDNNRTLVTAEAFADHAQDLELESVYGYGAVREWLKKIRRLGQTYIDLES